MMRGIVETLERHHGVRILEEAVAASVQLSHRYIPGRQLPDKSVSLLDTACARVAVSRAATPAPVEDARRRIEQLDVELRILEREQATGADHALVIAETRTAREQAGTAAEALAVRWKDELALIATVAEERHCLEAARLDDDEEGREASLARLRAARVDLETLQGEHPLVFDVVDRNAVADVVAAWTGHSGGPDGRR